jgi:hypothetical protein
MPAAHNDSLLPFTLPNVCREKVTAAFDGGTISSDGGVFLLAGADQRLGLIDALSALFPDHRDPAQISHPIADISRERIFAIACGYPDGNDLDTLRADPAFKMACGRLPESGANLASRPTISRLENTPDLRALIRMSHGMVDLWCGSHARAPKSITLDIGPLRADHSPARQNPGWERASRSHPTPCPAYSHALANDADYVSRRRPLRPQGGDGLVRRQ